VVIHLLTSTQKSDT